MAGIAACGGRNPPAASPPPAPEEPGLALRWSPEVCAADRPDSDSDGLGDVCELGLARAFAPELVVTPAGCDWDRSVEPARLGGEYYLAVGRAGGGQIRIAYLPAYYRDCGWRGAKCHLPGVDCAPHTGDSEAVVVEVGFDSTSRRWRTEGIFLSAHCFGRSHGDCRWYRGEDLRRFRWLDGRPRGAPIVWVAEGRNANYPTKSACDRGHFFIDTCDRNSVRQRFPVVSSRQNVGSAAHPIGGDGCVGGDQVGWGSRLAAPGSTECFWSLERRFRGWQDAGAGATPYARYLRGVAGFREPAPPSPTPPTGVGHAAPSCGACRGATSAAPSSPGVLDWRHA